MSWHLAGSLAQLRWEFDQAHPNRPTQSDGTIGDPAHAARHSDHNPDATGVVRAWDCTALVEGVPHPLAVFLEQARDPRVKYVISRGRIMRGYAKPGVPAWTWTPYTGVNGHFHHCHVSVVAGEAGEDKRPWGYPGNPTTTPSEDDMFTADDRKKLDDLTRIVARLETDYLTPGKGVRQVIVEINERTKRIAKRLLVGKGT